MGKRYRGRLKLLGRTHHAYIWLHWLKLEHRGFPLAIGIDKRGREGARLDGQELRPGLRAGGHLEVLAAVDRESGLHGARRFVQADCRDVLNQSAPHALRQPGCQLLPLSGGSKHNDLRLLLLDEVGEHLQVWRGRKLSQRGMVGHAHPVGTGLVESLCPARHAFSKQDPIDVGPQRVGQGTSGTQRLQRHRGHRTIHDIGHNPDATAASLGLGHLLLLRHQQIEI